MIDFDTPVHAARSRERQSQANDPYSHRHNSTFKSNSEFWLDTVKRGKH